MRFVEKAISEWSTLDCFEPGIVVQIKGLGQLIFMVTETLDGDSGDLMRVVELSNGRLRGLMGCAVARTVPAELHHDPLI